MDFKNWNQLSKSRVFLVFVLPGLYLSAGATPPNCAKLVDELEQKAVSVDLGPASKMPKVLDLLRTFTPFQRSWSSKEFSNPSQHSENFRYIVRSFPLWNKDEPYWLQKPEAVSDPLRVMSASVIDDKHTGSRGSAHGVILEVPEENVVGTHYSDSATHPWVNETSFVNQTSEWFSEHKLRTPSEILAKTPLNKDDFRDVRPDAKERLIRSSSIHDYNEVALLGMSPITGRRLKISGVFIKIDQQVNPIYPEGWSDWGFTPENLRKKIARLEEFARNLQVPIIYIKNVPLISVAPLPTKKEEPETPL